MSLPQYRYDRSYRIDTIAPTFSLRSLLRSRYDRSYVLVTIAPTFSDRYYRIATIATTISLRSLLYRIATIATTVSLRSLLPYRYDRYYRLRHTHTGRLCCLLGRLGLILTAVADVAPRYDKVVAL